MRKLLFGCGYLGQRVANLWIAHGDEVWVVTRRRQRAKELASDGFHPIVADITQPASLASLPSVATVLYAVGYDRHAGTTRREVYVDGLANVLDSLPSAELARIVYISSTGVFGQADGSWVDEDSPCQPTREGGQICLDGEQRLVSHPLGDRRIILRLAGIYGSGRVPRLETIMSGALPRGSENAYLNLIHVDDAVRTVCAAEQRATPPRLYLVSDGNPVPRGEFYREVARLAWPDQPSGSDRPSHKRSRSSEDSQRRAGSDKRVDNRRMLRELGVQLEYGSYREGLPAIACESQ